MTRMRKILLHGSEEDMFYTKVGLKIELHYFTSCCPNIFMFFMVLDGGIMYIFSGIVFQIKRLKIIFLFSINF